MTIPALVPAKALAAGKSRLRAALGAEVARSLALAMLRDVLSALLAVERIDPVAVVTPDSEIAALAREVGARPLLGDDPGLNASLERGANELDGREGLLVVLGDVAGARPADLEQLLAELDALGPGGVVLAPSRDGGTAALARRPHDIIPPRFGAESAAAHRALAKRCGAPLVEVNLPSLGVDVDSKRDLEDLLRGPGVGPFTARAFRDAGLGQ